jgi:hypothetical protein
VVLISSSDSEVAARGARYRAEFEQQFVALLGRVADRVGHDDPLAAFRYFFDTAFSAWVVRIAYGAEFSSLELDDDHFDSRLQELGIRYLLG